MESLRKILIATVLAGLACAVGLALWFGPRVVRSIQAARLLPGFRNFDHVEGTATLLADGRVLLAGRQAPFGPMSAEIYSPEQNAFSRAADLASPRGFTPVATLLKDGRVLIVGGSSTSHSDVETIEAYDPGTNTWKEIGRIPPEARISDALSLGNGSVLFTTGEGHKEGLLLFDPLSGGIKPVGHPAMVVNGSPLATLLADGQVLITHLDYGSDEDQAANAFLYDPNSETTKAVGRLAQGRQSHQATLLPDGRVLISGGADRAPSAEIFDPVKMTFSPAGEMVAPRALHRAVALSDGRVLIVAGVASGGTAAMPDPAVLKDKTPDEIIKIMKSIPTPKAEPLRAEAELFDPRTNKFTPVASPPAFIHGGMGPRTGVNIRVASGEVLFMSLHGPLYFVPGSNTWRFPPGK